MSFSSRSAGVARLQLLDHDRYRDLAERNWLRLEVLRAPRGRIFDTSGVLLASPAEHGHYSDRG